MNWMNKNHAQQIINVMRGEVSNLNESEINSNSGNLKGKCVETCTTLISGRCSPLVKV